MGDVESDEKLRWPPQKAGSTPAATEGAPVMGWPGIDIANSASRRRPELTASEWARRCDSASVETLKVQRVRAASTVDSCT